VQRLLLLSLVVASLALFAGAPPWTTPPLLALTLVAAFAHPRATFAFPRSDRLLDVALIAACAIVALQLIPLPIVIRDVLSPHAAGVVGAVRLDVRLAPPRFAPLSVDPRATWLALAALVMATLAFWTARGVVGAGGVRWIVRAVVIIGGALAVTALVYRAIDPDRMFGVWMPQSTGARPLGPFVNRNHFAGWMLLVMPMAVGYLLAHLRIHLRDDALRLRDLVHTMTRTWAMPVALNGVVMLVALLATLSRSAMVGLGVAAVVTWRLGHRRLAGSGLMRRLVVLTAVAAVAVLAVIDIDAIAARFASTLADRPVDRLVIWGETMRMVGDFWLLGVGAGAYGTGMLVYQQTQVRMAHLREWVHFNQAHSHYLQVPAEGGVLLAAVMVVGLAALVWCGRRAIAADRGEISLVRVGAAAGLAGMATQSLWETAMTIPANAIIGAVTAGVLLHHRHAAAGQPAPPVNRSSGGREDARHEPASPAAIRRTYNGSTRDEPGTP
jgi:O-antigen ligase